MSNKRDFCVWFVAASCAVLAVLPLKAAHGQEVDINQQICRGNLQFLGTALGLYLRENGGRLPARISELYTAGYVLDPGVFVCPGSGKQNPSEAQIDELTDFEMVAALPQKRPARLVWQKTAVEGAPRLAFYSDGSIEAWEADANDPSETGVRASSAGQTDPIEASLLDDGLQNARLNPEVEPNNSRDDASLAEIGKAMEATLGVTGDTDWYRFDVAHQGALGVKIGKVPEGLEMQFRVYDAKGKAIKRPEVSAGKGGGYSWVVAQGPGTEVAGVADLPAPGAYYVEVKEGRNRHSAEPYELALSFTRSADTGETNNELETATPIQIGERIAANMLPRGDSDWYSISVAHQGALGVKIGKVPEGLEMQFRVYDAKGKVIKRPEVSVGKAGGYSWVVAQGPGTEVAGVVDLPAPGAYYVEVKEGRNRRSAEPYELALSFTRSADTGETNNELETATPIQIGERIAANMLPRGDSDWYSISVAHQGALGVKIGKVPEGLEMRFRVYDVKGNAIKRPEVSVGKAGGYSWVVAQGPGKAVAGVVDLPAPGAYYVEVKEGRNRRSAEPYELALSFTRSADTGEMNNELETATPIQIGERIAANMLPRGDSDWYWLALGHPGALGVKIGKVPEGLEMQFRVYDVKGKAIKRPEVSAGKAGGYDWVVAQGPGMEVAGVADLPARGTYYVEVNERRDARSEKPYELTLSFVTAADDGEPDDNKALASLIETEKAVTATIMPRDDKDWYRFRADAAGVLGVQIDESPESLQMAFRVHDSKIYIKPEVTRGKAGGYGWVIAQKEGDSTAATVELPSAGIYYLELKARDGNVRSPEAYSFKMTFSSVR